jgi:hypothetical protein
MKKTRIISTILSLAFGAVIASGSSSAEATPAASVKSSCIVTQVAFDSHVFVQCAGDSVNYQAFIESAATNPRCTGTIITIDTLKIWESMFSSALLSGKPVDIYFVTGNAAGCLASPYIYNVGLKQ